MKIMRERRSNLVVLLFLALLSLFHVKPSHAAVTLIPGNTMRDRASLESSKKVFRLRFFNLNYSSNRYLGIQYLKYGDMKIVWMTNRENPLNDTSGILNITQDGNLVPSDSHGIFITLNSETPAMSSNTSAILLDSGYFIRKAGQQIVWQSLDHLIDTIMPGMRLGLFHVEAWTASKSFSSFVGQPRIPASRSIHSWS
nr:G-type lectin S-receptor-like serine/threonine-protein kinase At1g11300 [Ziziphus jujuba var. spinosa]